MIRSCAPREVVSDALRAKFDEMERKAKDEKKQRKGGAKVAPESDSAVEGGTGPALAESGVDGSGDGQSNRLSASGSLLGEGAGEEKPAESSAGSELP